MGRTRITMVNGEEYVVQKSLKEVLEEITNDFDLIFNGYYQINERVIIMNSNIVELRDIS